VSVTWLATLFFIALAAVAAGRGLARLGLSLAFSLSALATPYLHPEPPPLLRSLMALAASVALMRTVDLLLPRTTPSVGARIAHVVSIADSFHLRRRKPSLDLGSVVRALGFAALAAAGYHLAFGVADGVAPLAQHLALRWLGGALFCYAALDAAFAMVTGLYLAAGYDPGTLHRDPALARSIRELWGVRWSLLVSGWLGARVFRPLARKGHGGLGLAVSFFLSAALHAYVADAALGLRWGAVVGAFFVVQGLFAWLERPLRVARWPAWAGHAWTIAVMLGTSPLFSEATLRVVGAPL
jgi:hypothetical protein